MNFQGNPLKFNIDHLQIKLFLTEFSNGIISISSWPFIVPMFFNFSQPLQNKCDKLIMGGL